MPLMLKAAFIWP